MNMNASELALAMPTATQHRDALGLIIPTRSTTERIRMQIDLVRVALGEGGGQMGKPA